MQLFKKAMKMLEDATTVNEEKCIQFVPRTDEKNYVNIHTSSVNGPAGG